VNVKKGGLTYEKEERVYGNPHNSGIAILGAGMLLGLSR